MKSEQSTALARALKIIGGIILAVSFVGFAGLIARHWMDIPHDFKWAKMVFCCGLGLSNSGSILSKMKPEQDKSSRMRAIIGIAMLLCCSAISAIFLITDFTTRIFVPLTIGLIGDIIGGGFSSDDKDEEIADKNTTIQEHKIK